MQMMRWELEAWLGPALGDLTPEEVDRLLAEAQEIHARYPGVDQEDERDAALSAAVQRLLDDPNRPRKEAGGEVIHSWVNSPTYVEWMRAADRRIERGFSITLATEGGAMMCARWRQPHHNWLVMEYCGDRENGVWLADSRGLREEIEARLSSGKWVIFTD